MIDALGVSSDLLKGVSSRKKVWVTCQEIRSWKQVLSFHRKGYSPVHPT